MQERDASYTFEFGELSKQNSKGGEEEAGNNKIVVTVKGLKKELGQTLDSTGLTLWAAAEQMCGYINGHREQFEGVLFTRSAAMNSNFSRTYTQLALRKICAGVRRRPRALWFACFVLC